MTEIVTRYIIGIAAAVSGDLDYAEGLHRDVLDHLPGESEFPVYIKLRDRIPIRLAEISMARAREAHSRWMVSRSEEDSIEIGEHLNQVDERYRKDNQYVTLRSIYLFVVKREVEGALKLLRANRAELDPAWYYNMAFLEAYRGNLLGAAQYYRALQRLSTNDSVNEQVDRFLEWLREEEPELVQLSFCEGYIAWKIRGDKVAALAEFREFVRRAEASNEFAAIVSRVKRWMKKLESESDD